MHPLHKLQVHAEATSFAQLCYRHARSIVEFDLRAQFLRSARSIAANLAEGAGAPSQAVFARYVAIALASGRETQSHLEMARISGQPSLAQYDELAHWISRLMPRMYRLHAALKQNAARRAKTES
ncbi:MAG: four helix bundle protein [Gemmatimonadaceae bacterium]|nr:four helix bundle protein [Gemmatimonadaceae bacterium]